jgi:alpha-glucosidase
MESYEDGVNADRFGSDFRQLKSSVSKSTKLHLKLAPGGGWAARIHP